MFTSVEQSFLERSGKKSSYEGERTHTIEVLNVYELGKIVALSFLEWVESNPQGVVALPTGKTPEYFIKTLEKYKKDWDTPQIQEEIKSHGYPATKFPNTSQLKFVMLDEFFPMLPSHRNSFCNYVRTYYTHPLGISESNVLNFDLIAHGVVTEEEMKWFDKKRVDLSLLNREPANEDETKEKQILLQIESYCHEYEQKIRDMGGIGFFLGGIGPDGHIAFNQEGSAFDSKTRLVTFNYPSAAAAAGDLGGIEIAHRKAAMTIGLETITYKHDAKIIIMAAGEGKATVVREAIEEEPNVSRPSSVLQGLPNARFYITHGAAMKLTERKQEKLLQVSQADVLSFVMNHLAGNTTTEQNVAPHFVIAPADYLLLESTIYEISLTLKKPVHTLTLTTVRNHPHTTIGQDGKHKIIPLLPIWLQENEIMWQMICMCASRRLKEKIEGGLKESTPVGKCILHTAPHHDDIMLSYHGGMHSMLGRQPNGELYVPEDPVSLQQQTHTTHPPNHHHGHTHGHSSAIGHNHTSTPTNRLKKTVPGIKLTRSGLDSPRAALMAHAQHGAGGGHHRRNLSGSGSFNVVINTSSQPNTPRNHAATAALGEAFNQNTNYFAYLTSGFHSVNDEFLATKIDSILYHIPHFDSPISPVTEDTNTCIPGERTLTTSGKVTSTMSTPTSSTKVNTPSKAFLEEVVNNGQLQQTYDEIMLQYAYFFHTQQYEHLFFMENIIFLRKIMEIGQMEITMSYTALIQQLYEKLLWIEKDYVLTHQPGDAVPKEMQLLKGCMRESEVDRVWAFSSMPMNRIYHMRSKFYTDDFFTPMPSLEDDALPMANLIRAKQPHVVTVAFDPEGTGPDTHYKVLQVVAAGLRISYTRHDLPHFDDLLIWGYRNVWFQFLPSYATLMIPVTKSDLELMHQTFMHCFTTQKEASFPSPYYDGPFSLWAKAIQEKQREELEILLGADYFTKHANVLVQNAAGFVYIQAMYLGQFLDEVEELKSRFENIAA